MKSSSCELLKLKKLKENILVIVQPILAVLII